MYGLPSEVARRIPNLACVASWLPQLTLRGSDHLARKIVSRTHHICRVKALSVSAWARSHVPVLAPARVAALPQPDVVQEV